MSEPEFRQYFLSTSRARELKGKIIDRLEREGDAVKIWFADGTAISISGDRPQYGRLMVYFFEPMTTR